MLGYSYNTLMLWQSTLQMLEIYEMASGTLYINYDYSYHRAKISRRCVSSFAFANSVMSERYNDRGRCHWKRGGSSGWRRTGCCVHILLSIVIESFKPVVYIFQLMWLPLVFSHTRKILQASRSKSWLPWHIRVLTFVEKISPFWLMQEVLKPISLRFKFLFQQKQPSNNIEKVRQLLLSSRFTAPNSAVYSQRYSRSGSLLICWKFSGTTMNFSQQLFSMYSIGITLCTV